MRAWTDRADGMPNTAAPIDRAGFAWELLRRNADYRRFAIGFDAFCRVDVQGIVRISAVSSAEARYWGLSFRGRSEPYRTRATGFLGA